MRFCGASKWLETDQDNDNLHMKFLALNADFNSPSLDTLSSRRPAQAGVKDSYPLKSGYFTASILCSVKTIADIIIIGTCMLLIITSNSDKFFYWCQHR